MLIACPTGAAVGDRIGTGRGSAGTVALTSLNFCPDDALHHAGYESNSQFALLCLADGTVVLIQNRLRSFRRPGASYTNQRLRPLPSLTEMEAEHAPLAERVIISRPNGCLSPLLTQIR